MLNYKGIIRYYFKGAAMRDQSATIVEVADQNNITALIDNDRQSINFVYNEGRWLMKNHTSSNSLLYGSQFIMV